MIIGKKIKEERTKKNLTQEKLADKFHVSRATISSWETGRTYPDLNTIIEISDFFEVPLDELLREDNEVVEKITDDSRLRKKQTKIIKILLLIFIPVMLLLSFLLWQDKKSINVSYSQIESATVSEKGIVSIILKGNRLYNYSGYMADYDESTGEVQIELIQKLGFYSNAKQEVEIPIEFDVNKKDIKKVLIVNDNRENVIEVKKEG